MKRGAEVAVGSVILIGIAVVFFGTLWLKGARLNANNMEVQARFAEVGQLLEGNAVKLRGVPIGKVETIGLEPGGGGVLVTMQINRDVPLPPDPIVLLSPESMFGDWQAEIFPRSRFPQYKYAEAADPQVLPGYSLPDISRLTAVADRIAENLAVLTDRVEQAFTEETAANIRRAIENIEDVSGQLTSLIDRQSSAADQVAGSLERTSETVNETVAAIRSLVAQVEEAASEGQLKQAVQNVVRATAALDTLSTALAGSSPQIKRTIASADSAFASLNAVMGGIERGEGTVGRLARDSTLYNELIESNDMVQILVDDFMKHPRKYINLRVF